MLRREKRHREQMFPDRICERCGRKGGGDPAAGPDNVVVEWGHQGCGHCLMEFSRWINYSHLWELFVRSKPEASG